MNKVSSMNAELIAFVQSIVNEFDQISTERKSKLEAISKYLQGKLANGSTPPKAIVICTHNSRRSHLGQAWLQLAASWFQIEPFEAYSGGTEATAFYSNAIKALQEVGWQISQETEEDNPIYLSTYDDTAPPLKMFSKAYNHKTNPQSQFAAIMVCTQADEGCPVVFGAEARFSIPYNDPKEFDGTPVALEKYKERSREIAREMFYIMSKV